MIERDWHGCYGEGWGTRLQPEAYAHPAKVSYGLASRIVEHLLEYGWLKPGDAVVDPFGGIGGFALPLMTAGCHFVGVELERPFVDMGQGCDCTGMNKADWVRFYGRWKQARYRDGRHWCPRCLAQAQEIHDKRQESKPCYAQRKRRGRMRELATALKRPLRFTDPLPLPGTVSARRRAQQMAMFATAQTTAYRRNSGRIPTTGAHHYAGNIEAWAANGLTGTGMLVQGDSRELVRVVEQVVGASVSSPPYAQIRPEKSSTGVDLTRQYETYRAQGGGASFEKFCATQRLHSQGYGNSSGQLAVLHEGDHAAAVQAAVGSPPYAGDIVHARPSARDDEFFQGRTIGTHGTAEYGSAEGQLAAMPAGDLRAAVSSPPYTASLASDDPDKRGGLFRDPKRRNDKTLIAEYGESDGQLGTMKEGDFAGCVSSSPYEGSEGSPSLGSVNKDNWGNDGRDIVARRGLTANYGSSDDQLGHTQGDTFWSAAKTIVEQTHQVLASGAVAVWVCKRFVRNKAIVDFSAQWAELCEACGFETVEWIRAWLVEDKGAQWRLDGELEKREIKRISFFRRLHTQKYPHLSIDWEDVIVMRKLAASAPASAAWG